MSIERGGIPQSETKPAKSKLDKTNKVIRGIGITGGIVCAGLGSYYMERFLSGAVGADMVHTNPHVTASEIASKAGTDAAVGEFQIVLTLVGGAYVANIYRRRSASRLENRESNTPTRNLLTSYIISPSQPFS